MNGLKLEIANCQMLSLPRNQGQVLELVRKEWLRKEYQ